MKNLEVERKYGEKFLEMISKLMEEKSGFNWMNPCFYTSADVSYSTGKGYKGINRTLLALTRMYYEYESRVWITFNQVKELQKKHPEVKVKKGSKMVPIIFWKKFVTIYKSKEAEESEGESDEVETPEESKDAPSLTRWMLKTYYVLNTDCIEGYDFKQPMKKSTEQEQHTMQEWEEILIKDYIGGAPVIWHDGEGKNFYRPATDDIHLSTYSNFKSPDRFLSTCAHELVHSTGHYTRLDRLDGTNAAFGSDDYGKEELVAELGASMICAEFGISERVIDNQAEYLKNWYNAIKAKPEMLMSAFTKAEKAVNWILGIKNQYSN